MNNLITIDDVLVRLDAQGRYCLNDLHKAAMANGKATENHAPNQFLRNEGIQNFVSALDAEVATEAELTAKMQLAQKIGKLQKSTSVHTIKGGKNPGIYAVELVAIRYAAWIDPAFEIRVYRTFQKSTKDKSDWRRQRHIASASSRMMDSMLQDVRKAIGKATEGHHFGNEHRMINSLLSGEYEGLDRETLPLYQLDFLAHFEIRNAKLMVMGLTYEQRKGALKVEALAWREAHAIPDHVPAAPSLGGQP